LTLFLIPLTLLDRRINHWYEPKLTSYRQNFIAKIIFFILLIQVAVIYLQAGVEKLYLCKEFVDGTAVYYWFNHNIFGLPEWLRPAVNSLLKYPIIMAFTTWGTVIFEIVMFGIVFSSPPVRRKFLWAAIIFHLSILFFFGLFSFFFAMMGCIILYCLPWDEQIEFKKILRR